MTAPVHVRFRFGEFVLSPRRRLLLRGGVPVPLIPKYFDLLLLLVVRRHDAVSKQDIFADVWADVVVSDGALSQAIRTLRRTLGDDSRQPRFIRTVSRHGYQFAWPDVAEEMDDGLRASGSDVGSEAGSEVGSEVASIEALVDRLMAAAGDGQDEEGRDAAERLHARGTAEALALTVARPGHARALAMLRDARWNVPGAGEVPLLRDPERVRAIGALIGLRAADARRMVAHRWASAAGAGALGGAAAGAVGGLTLHLSPTSNAPLQAALALAAIGSVAGGFAAAGVAAGLAAAEVLARSRRGLALVACGALSGLLVGTVAQALLQALLDGLFGIRLDEAAGAAPGLALGAAAGGGYGLATRQPRGGGLAAPSGLRRLLVVVLVGLCSAAAAAGLARSGYLLVGGLVHEVARSSRDARLVLGPLGHLIGEPGYGPITRTLLSAFEGAVFGGALAWGLTRRPRLSGDSPA